MEKRAVKTRKNRDLFENIAEYMRLFSHPIAVGVVYALSERPGLKRNVGQITEFIDVPRVSVSKVLSKMRMMGVVESDRHGTEKYYYLCENDDTAKKIVNIIAEGS